MSTPELNSNFPELYQFPPTRFVTNSLWRQWWNILSEVMEIGFALLSGDLQHAMAESWDVSQSLETFRHIGEGQGADNMLARQTVISNNIERDYYRV